MYGSKHDFNSESNLSKVLFQYLYAPEIYRIKDFLLGCRASYLSAANHHIRSPLRSNQYGHQIQTYPPQVNITASELRHHSPTTDPLLANLKTTAKVRQLCNARI